MSRSEASEGQAGQGSGGLSLGVDGRFELLPGVRLPRLDSPHAEAYEARDLREPDRPHFALVCRRELLPRVDILERVSRLDRSSIVKPRQWGVVDWHPAGGRRFAIVFEQPGGGRVFGGSLGARAPIRLEDIRRFVIAPLVPLLQELSERGITHRAIRPDNLFYADESRRKVALGESVSAPPGLAQAAVFETIENGMAEPSGRGPGYPPDDLYAFGVLLAVLLTGEIPCADMTDQEIVAAKLKRGSYSALCGRARIPLAMLEPLRGLLCDDPSERWTAGDLKSWLGGRQLTPKLPALPPKATRPFRFAGAEYLDARSLAHALAHDWPSARPSLYDGKIADWMLRSLGNEPRAQLIGNTMRRRQYASAEDGCSDDRTVSRVLMALDPEAPLRYKGLAVNIEGLGAALAVDYHKPEKVQLFVEMLRGRLPLAWFDAQLANRPEFLSVKKLIEQACSFASRARAGFGIERCLYQLNPQWPCQSPLLAQEYVCYIKDLLPALERIAGRGMPSEEPVDRHIAAFCVARVRQVPERLLNNLAAQNTTVRHLAMLQLLADVQQRTGPARLPALTRWYANLLAPAIDGYRNRPYRKRLADEIARLVEQGELGLLSVLFDNPAAVRADEQGFAVARAQYRQAANRISWLEQGGLSGPDNVLRASRQAASMVSAVLAGLMLVVLTVFYAM
ncbi:MAG: hypothetical protein OEM93_09210 [Rhodospirillales bacterium]|nr:hypothetical protein [Rhodospirillales bacterium]MDH3966756.1 hypothetical protein [Rhodospirillales bacterium]